MYLEQQKSILQASDQDRVCDNTKATVENKNEIEKLPDIKKKTKAERTINVLKRARKVEGCGCGCKTVE